MCLDGPRLYLQLWTQFWVGMAPPCSMLKSPRFPLLDRTCRDQSKTTITHSAVLSLYSLTSQQIQTGAPLENKRVDMSLF